MSRYLIAAVALFVVCSAATPSLGKGWWWICWRPVVVGAGNDGRKVHCNQCYVEHRKKRGRTPEGECESFLSKRSAAKFFYRKCDCPDAGQFPE